MRRFLSIVKWYTVFNIFLMSNESMAASTSQHTTEQRLIPRVGVGVIVEKEGRVLLGKRKGSHGACTWAPPGGHLEFGESVTECAKRELMEETGLLPLSCNLGPWVEDVMENQTKHYITVFVVIDQCEGEPQVLEPDKCEGWQWFSWDALPQPLFASFASFVKKRNL